MSVPEKKKFEFWKFLDLGIWDKGYLTRIYLETLLSQAENFSALPHISKSQTTN